jgi:HJR/Mrr/RecB family endonuclease
MAYRRKRKYDSGGEFERMIFGILVLYFLILIWSYKFDQSRFWKWLGWGSGVVIIITIGLVSWIVVQKKFRQRRVAKLLERVKQVGLENEIKNFITRFGQEKKTNHNVWTYREYRIDWNRIRDFEQHAEEKGCALTDSDMSTLLHRYIGEKEYSLTTESVLTESRELNSLSGSEFERMLKRLFEAMDYQVEMKGGVGDQGGDLIANSEGKRILVQAKRYAGSVGNDAVQEAYTAMKIYDCSSAFVITTGAFTNAAMDAAKSTHVRLIGKEELQQKLLEYLNENWK